MFQAETCHPHHRSKPYPLKQTYLEIGPLGRQERLNGVIRVGLNPILLMSLQKGGDAKGVYEQKRGLVRTRAGSRQLPANQEERPHQTALLAPWFWTASCQRAWRACTVYATQPVVPKQTDAEPGVHLPSILVKRAGSQTRPTPRSRLSGGQGLRICILHRLLIQLAAVSSP